MDADLLAAQARIDELIRIAKAKEERLHALRRRRTESSPNHARTTSFDSQRSVLSRAEPQIRASSAASLASEAPTSRHLSPTADDAELDDAPEEAGLACEPPPLSNVTLFRRSSSLVTVEASEPNRKPLGQLQVGGRKEYDSSRSSCARGTFSEHQPSRRRSSFGLGVTIAGGAQTARGTLTPSALPAAVVASWQVGELSPDLALREMLDAVCRQAASGDNREMAAISAHLDAQLALGGALGGLAGGLPACAAGGVQGAAALQPLRAMLHMPPDVVLNQSLHLFTTELLTGAESSSGGTAAPALSSPHGDDRSITTETRRLTNDLAKLSAEELNLAFRRACLVRHPNRPNGSLSSLLHTHLAFELVRFVWSRLDDADGLSSFSRASSAADTCEVDFGAHVASDTAVSLELAKSEAELVAEELGDDEIELLNSRMQARGMWWAHARELLESQLEAMEAVGAYAVLGIAPSATDKELSTAYREAARRTHPDRGGDKVEFQRLQAAYSSIVTARKAGGGKSEGGSRPGGGGSRSGKCKSAKRKGATGGENRRAADRDDARDAPAEEKGPVGQEDEEPKSMPIPEEKHPGGRLGDELELDENDDPTPEAASPLKEAAEAAEAGESAEAAAAKAEAAAAAFEAQFGDGSGRADDPSAADNSSIPAKGVDGDSDEPPKSAAAEAAAAEAEAALGGDLDDVDLGVGDGPMDGEALCRAAEAAAEAARACAASVRIAKRVCAIGSGGWEVLCECAQCVLRACRNAAAAASKVGKHALEAPADASAALDEAGSRKGLGKRADRAVRQLMEAMTLALRQGRCSTLAASLCAAKAGEAASLILSLAKLPPSGSRLTAAVGAPQLASLMSRVSEVLSDMAAAVSDAADHAMATATAACDVVRKAESVRELVAAAGGSKSDVDSSSDGSDSEEGDENVREARRKAEADARERAEAEARAQEAASEDGGAAAAAAREVQRAIAEAPPAVQKRVTNARWLRKLAVEMAEMQGKMRELCTISPQLLPGVGIGQKEELFELLSEVLRSAEAPILRRWYREAGANTEPSAAEWADLVNERLSFVFHSADHAALPVPEALAARLLRQAALVDFELTAKMLRMQLLQRVLLFAPAAATRVGGPLEPLPAQFENALSALAKHCAPECTH